MDPEVVCHMTLSFFRNATESFCRDLCFLRGQYGSVRHLHAESQLCRITVFSFICATLKGASPSSNMFEMAIIAVRPHVAVISSQLQAFVMGETST